MEDCTPDGDGADKSEFRDMWTLLSGAVSSEVLSFSREC